MPKIDIDKIAIDASTAYPPPHNTTSPSST
jgi:hypothetical protein